MTATTLAQRAWVEQIMGLPVSIHLRGPDLTSEPVAAAVAAAFAELRHIDAVLSPYRNDSDLSRWERRELKLDSADPTLAEVVSLCEEAIRRTDGWFDPRGLPDPRTGEPRYDPSGLVKGWAVERAAQHLAALAGYSWCFNAGGDVLVHAPAARPRWRIGIEHPFDPTRIMRVLELRSGAVATSGSTHRGFHILDPRTRRPASAVRAISVTGPTLLWADVYATAAAARGGGALPWIQSLPGYDALAVLPSGLVRTTNGWPAAGPL
ncbi:thiamine biosynthesis lipoprotein [Actinoplanes tereljensis]|uniref:FAD:protein FMN transferase n=1 Tax=Paractinoplanes tereljensis TaxID=571912 RepID=A0A919NQR6_9ACTN|nr:FAD:protein FMN transferase [Actinoplanes tereljensis]GIF23386.1 FAD:protein FMN transferase [Actinoplanes tereljensis]